MFKITKDIKKLKHSNIKEIISKRKIKSQLKIPLFVEAFKILIKKNVGRVTYNANFVSIFAFALSNIFFALNAVPKKIIAKKGIVIDKTVPILILFNSSLKIYLKGKIIGCWIEEKIPLINYPTTYLYYQVKK